MDREAFAAKQARMAELSKNWPDPTSRRKSEPLKPIHVPNPHTARMIEEAKDGA